MRKTKREEEEQEEDVEKEKEEEEEVEEEERSVEKKKKKKKAKREEEGEKEEKRVKEEGGCFEVYVEGIPYSQSEEDLSHLFASHKLSVVKVNLPRWHDSGRPRGYAHVGLVSEEERDRAVKELNGFKIEGRYLAVSIAKGKNKGASSASAGRGASAETVPDNCTILFVKNLPYETTEEEVKDCFEQYAKVESVRLARWNHTQNLKGFGYITFVSPKELIKAMDKAKKSWFKVGGRDVTVDFETKPPPPRKEKETTRPERIHR